MWNPAINLKRFKSCFDKNRIWGNNYKIYCMSCIYVYIPANVLHPHLCFWRHLLRFTLHGKRKLKSASAYLLFLDLYNHDIIVCGRAYIIIFVENRRQPWPFWRKRWYRFFGFLEQVEDTRFRETKWKPKNSLAASHFFTLFIKCQRKAANPPQRLISKCLALRLEKWLHD